MTVSGQNEYLAAACLMYSSLDVHEMSLSTTLFTAVYRCYCCNRHVIKVTHMLLHESDMLNCYQINVKRYMSESSFTVIYYD